ncbi:SDR family NAD(P)-dependent oxidoreductase [Rhodoferax sediminis]|uniref:SDR family NAD(P)-dependent oxidoreductase n=1 Tax=Rhodoferax sediminis TaxID=2509614 RepID=A0A515DE94_9BURK|nr:SDR family NAD(P)-dependent oxidoreductase [Rhodoferax sediminis]QDL38690.1 SDR family NAD(P)-dependent oxidoreductase [Rhodoferax sediminis]
MNSSNAEKIVITSASSGLSEATARHLSSLGATAILGADRVNSLAAELTGLGPKALAVAKNLTRAAQVKHLVDAAVQTFGRVDVMLDNASLMPDSPLKRLKIDDWGRIAELWRPCIEPFGADRCMVSSNTPVDKPAFSYGRVWDTFKRITAVRSDEEKRLIFGGTAKRVYRLD